MSQFGLEIFKCLLSDKTLNLYILLVRFREFIVLITLPPLRHSFRIAYGAAGGHCDSG